MPTDSNKRPARSPARPRTRAASATGTKASAARSRSKNKGRSRSKRPPTRSWWSRIVLALLALLLLAAIPASLYAWRLHHQVVSQFEQRRWDLPARVFSAPIDLFVGADIGRDQLLQLLRDYGYQAVSRPGSPGQYHYADNHLHLITRAFNDVAGNSPAQEVRLDFIGQRIRGVRTPDGAGYSRIEPIEIGVLYFGEVQDRLPVRLDQVPPDFIQALLAVEDRSFYEHWGVNPVGIARAAWVNAQSGRSVQGGSTLTQQLVKNLYLSNERSYWRKINEAIMAVSLEMRFSKEDILETYLNEVFVAQDGNRAIHGFGLASQFYFGKPLIELDITQQALLIGLIKGPSLYNPIRFPERAQARRDLVLQITHEQLGLPADLAQAQGNPLALNISRRSGQFPAYMDLVRQQLREDYDDQVLFREGLRVYTSLRPWVHAQAQASMTHSLTAMEQRHQLPADELEASMVVVQPFTGEVLAVLGGRRPLAGGFNRALDMRRQSGSLLKPAIYLAALRSNRYHLLSPLDDSPVSVRLPEGGEWQPSNFNNQSHGWVPLYKALALSYNQAAARLGMDVGLKAFFDTLTDLGLDPGAYPAVPSVMLGAAELSPLQIAVLYQTLANNGYRTDLSAIRGVMTSDGELLVQYRRDHRQRIATNDVYLLNVALQKAMSEGTGRSAYQSIPQSVVLAGKTGTTDGRRDSWFSGWAGSTLAVTWVGYDNNRPTPLTGSTGALQLWTHFMEAMLIQTEDSLTPQGVSYQWALPEQNATTESQCAGAQSLPFKDGVVPATHRSCLWRPGTDDAVVPDQPRTPPARANNWLRELLGR